MIAFVCIPAMVLDRVQAELPHSVLHSSVEQNIDRKVRGSSAINHISAGKELK